MTQRVTIPIGAIVTAVTIVVWHCYSSGVIIAVMSRHEKAIAMAALQVANIFLVVSGDIASSSAGLNFIVELKNENRRKH